MPEIKNTFVGGRMNKDLDERLVPNGEYRDALNIQIGTSEGANVGTVQNILGNSPLGAIIPSNCKCVGAIADEKNDRLYWFIKRDFKPDHVNIHAIVEYTPGHGLIPILIDTKVNTPEAVLKFPDKIITGINIIDNLLFWTDGVNDPRKINIDECKKGTPTYAPWNINSHTKLHHELGSFDGITIEIVGNNVDDDGNALPGGLTQSMPGFTNNDPTMIHGKYFNAHKHHLDKLFDHELINGTPPNTNAGNGIHTIRHYRNGKFLGYKDIRYNDPGAGGIPQCRLDSNTLNNVVTTDYDRNRSWYIGDVIYGAGTRDNINNVPPQQTPYDDTGLDGIPKDIREDHITVIKEVPKSKLNIKINTSDNPSKDPLFEKVLPRFSYRYKYNDNQYSPFAPFTDVVFNPEHKDKYSLDTAYNVDEPYNTSMLNVIESVELFDFVSPSLKEDVKQVDILYKQENSPIVYIIDSITREDPEWHSIGSTQGVFVGDINIGGAIKGKYTVNSENLNSALPEDQLLRPWDNVPKKALAQEITGNRIVYGNYVQGYTPESRITGLTSDYVSRDSDYLPSNSFDDVALPSIKSQRNYQLGVVFGDKYGRETPVFTSKNSAITVPWKNSDGILSATQSHQIEVRLEKDPPNFAEYIKYFVKETSGEYYNIIMEKAYLPVDISEGEMKHHIWLSFPSSERNKVTIDDYLILKKKIGSGETQVQEKNRFKILDIQNEAPDAIKYNYALIGSMDDGFANFSTAVPIAPTLNGKRLRITIADWISDGGGHLGGIDWDTQVKTGDVGGYEKGSLYVSWSKTDGAYTRNSNKYQISTVLRGPNAWTLNLDKPISGPDNQLWDITNSKIRIELRVEKDAELFSGKFFVKVISNPIVYGNILDDKSLLSQYVATARRSVFWVADTQGDPTPAELDSGILNSQNYNVPTGGTNSPKLLHTKDVTKTPAHWNDILTLWGNSKFFIDNAWMIQGQISDNNYAKNTGQMWVGEPAYYPPNPIWVGSSIQEGNLDSKGVRGLSVSQGWKHYNKMSMTKIHAGSATQKGLNTINGLEGIINTTNMHTGKPYSGTKHGIRRWKKEKTTGQGMHNAEPDNTYGKEGETGKYFLHLSFLAPGEDLVDGTTQFGDEMYGDNAIAKGLQGIWGGGVFSDLYGYGFDGDGSGGVLTQPQTHRILPMEGKHPIDGDNNEPPGPGVPNSFGYDENYRERHENQWNPCWPSDPGGEIKKFIDNLAAGKKFRFEGDTANTVYTILKKSIKKVYNHTPWKAYRAWDDNGGGVMQKFADHPSQYSIERRAQDWVETCDAGGANGNSGKFNLLKDSIKDFGLASNRRVVYILELDKNPRSSSTYNPIYLNIDLNTEGKIQFIEEASSFVEVNADKPIVWETEPKESTDLKIYHEASAVIPTKIDSNTNELFAPVGCKVERLFNREGVDNPGGNLDWSQYLHTDTNILVGWLDHNKFELHPGFLWDDGYGNEKDYSNIKLKFTRKDGSYTTGVLSAQEPDPTNINGTGGTSGHKTKFLISQNVEGDLESGLSWYNCFSFGNGLESNRIKDGFNEMQITNGPIVSSTIESDYKEEKRKSGLIYSGIYNSNSGTNNLNQFIMADKITKDLNPTYGSIQKLFQRRVGLVAFCEDRVVDIIAGKDTLFNADGNPQLVASNKVLGTATPFVGDFGISKNPESFANESYRAYFTDKQRGAVLRLSMDGLTPISDIGMRDWFRDNLIQPNELIGTYDEYKKEYNLTLTQNFTENLLRNASITEGEVLVNLTPPASNLIENGGIGGGTSISSTRSSILTDPNKQTLENLIGWDAMNFASETEITNYDLIPEGHHRLAVPVQGGWPETYAAFTNTHKTIFDGNLRGMSKQNASVQTWDVHNPFGNSTSADHNDYGIGYKVGEFHYPGKDNYRWLTDFTSSNTSWNVNGKLERFYRWYYSTTLWTFFHAASTTPSSLPYGSSVGGLIINSSSFFQDFGSGAGRGMHWHHNDSNQNNSITIPGKRTTTSNWTSQEVIDYGERSPREWYPSDPTRPSDEVPQDILDWADDPQNILVNTTANSVNGVNYGESETTVDGAVTSGGGFTPFGTYGSSDDWSITNNTSIFAGEEIEVTFTIVGVWSGAGFTMLPTTAYYYAAQANPATIDITLELQDGISGGQVWGSEIFDPADDQTGTTSLTVDGTTYTTITNNYTNNPYNCLSTTNTTENTNSAKTMGYQSSSTVAFHPINWDGAIPVAGLSQWDSTDPHMKEIVCKAKWKFSNEVSNISQAPAMEAAMETRTNPVFGFPGYNVSKKVIEELNIKFSVSNPNGAISFFIDDFKIEKILSLETPENPGQLSIPSQAAIPPADVPAWAEVENRLKNAANAQEDAWYIPPNQGTTVAYNAVQTYGPNNPTTNTTIAAADTGISYSWPTPNPNNVTDYNDYNDGVIDNGYDVLHMDPASATVGTGNGAYIVLRPAFNIPEIATAGKWLMVDIITDDLWAPQGNTNNNWGLFIRNVLDTNMGLSQLNQTAFYYNPDWFTSDIPYGTYGHGFGGSWANDERSIVLGEVAAHYPSHTEIHGGDIIDLSNYSSTTINNSNSRLWRAVFKVGDNSYNAVNNHEEFRILDWRQEGKIKHINIRDISETVTGGDINHFRFRDVNAKWGLPTFSNPTSWKHPHYNAHDDILIVNSISKRKLFYNNGAIHFVEAALTGQHVQQSFSTDTAVPWQLTAAQDGYELKITVSNFVQNGEELRVSLVQFDDGSNDFSRMLLHVDGDGDYIVNFNLTTPSDVGGVTSATKNGLPYTKHSYNTYTTGATANHNSIAFRPKQTLSSVPYHTDTLTCSINSVSLSDTSNIITGGSIDYWEFIGFDPTDDNFIYFENNAIVLNEAKDSHEIRQVINGPVKTGDSYRINFNHNLTSGVFYAYYFNSQGKGFRTFYISSGGPYVQGTTGLPGSPAYYDRVHQIGDATINDSGYSGELQNTFVIKFVEWFSFTAQTTQDFVSGTLDNFSMKKEFINFDAKTLSFSEETKGWVSFKSFIPENGVSLSKQYYTMKDGQLWKHHSNETRNQFYDQGLNYLPESYIITIFNQEPSLVKIFNTLNYEGSQSKVQQYNIYNIDKTIRPDNVSKKSGWYVDYIKTDKQEGTLKEFIEKEGKWFNYIRGAVPTNGMKTSEFSFQGLGIVSSIQ